MQFVSHSRDVPTTQAFNERMINPKRTKIGRDVIFRKGSSTKLTLQIIALSF